LACLVNLTKEVDMTLFIIHMCILMAGFILGGIFAHQILTKVLK